jgi:hypothetical protein
MKARAVAVLAGLSVAGAANAHHAFAPVYDASRTVTVAGIVKEFRFVNPHAMLVMDVKDEAGKVVTWTVEFSGRLNLSNTGWTADTIAVGESLTVTGNPTHTNSPRLFFTQLVRANGAELRAGGDRFNTLDEERRQRREQRDQQSATQP